MHLPRHGKLCLLNIDLSFRPARFPAFKAIYSSLEPYSAGSLSSGRIAAYRANTMGSKWCEGGITIM